MECVGVLIGHEGPVLVSKFNSTGNYCMTGSSDRTLRLWNPTKSLCIKTYAGPHNYDVFDLDIASDSSRFVSGGGDKLVFVWDVQTAKAIRKFTGHAQRVKAVCWNPEATVVISGSEDGTLKVWDCRSGDKDPIDTMRDFRDSVTCVRVKNEEIIASSLDGCLRSYDVRKGEAVTDEMKVPIHSFDLSSYDRCALTSHVQSQLCIMDLNNGTVLTRFHGSHKGTEFKLACCLTKDNKRAFVGSEDMSVVGYSLIGDQVIKGDGHAGAVVSVDSHPKDASLILSGSFDTTARLWQIPSVPVPS